MPWLCVCARACVCMCVCVCEGVLFREFCLVFPTTSLLQNKLGALCDCYSNFQVYKYQIYITDKEITSVDPCIQ